MEWFKNSIMNQFCEMKGIKREFSVARTPQQNGVAERKNRTLIEAARTMLVKTPSSKPPFGLDAVNIACHAQKEKEPEQEYILIPLCTTDPLISQGPKDSEGDVGMKPTEAPRAWYETLSTYLLDHGFHRGQIDKTLFIQRQKDDILLVQVYVDDIIFGSTKKELSMKFEKLMHDKFQMSSMGELSFFLGLQVQQKSTGIFICQDKYVAEILKKFDFVTVKIASTPIDPNKALVKDEEAEDVDVHVYRSMIGSLMYLTASRPDITFVVCACARFQVNPKTSHLHAVKRIFRYLKGQPKLGLWYPKDSPFDLEAFSDSDYAGASLDRKSTTGAEYVAAANCCGHVLWIQNQMLDYGFNFMNTKIYIDNESTICVVKNPVFYSKTKHIEIRHHFIRDSYEKKLIQVIKIHTDNNVADLLTKAFDVSVYKRLMLFLQELVLLVQFTAVGPCMMLLSFNFLLLPWKLRLDMLFGYLIDTKIPQSSGPPIKVGDEAVHKEWGDKMERAAGTDIQEKNKKKAKNKQIRARSGKDQVKSKSKVIHMKKIQLEGLKLPNLKLYCKRKRQGSKLQRRQRLHSSYTT
ncbi:putative ribonuclease H-like domain-containing protein [Tanacetum coccineum]